MGKKGSIEDKLQNGILLLWTDEGGFRGFPVRNARLNVSFPLLSGGLHVVFDVEKLRRPFRNVQNVGDALSLLKWGQLGLAQCSTDDFRLRVAPGGCGLFSLRGYQGICRIRGMGASRYVGRRIGSGVSRLVSCCHLWRT